MQEKFFQIINFLKYKLLARHRKGFSVHSPFVFELLNNVFFEKEHYYCYEENEKELQKKYPKIFFRKDIKYYRLFFRLANYFNAKNMLILGNNPCVEKYLLSVSKEIMLMSFEKLDIVSESYLSKFIANNWKSLINNERDEKFDLIFFPNNSIENYKNYNLYYKENSILIFENIYKNRKINEIWKNICNDNSLKISIDIFRFGIIINKDIPKQHYRVAF